MCCRCADDVQMYETVILIGYTNCIGRYTLTIVVGNRTHAVITHIVFNFLTAA